MPANNHARANAWPRRNWLFIALMLALPTSAAAVEFDYAIGAGLMYTDNVNHGDSDPIEDKIASVRLDFALQERSRHVDLSVRGDVEHFNYIDNVYDDEVRGQLAANFDWIISPDRLKIVVEDSLGYEPVDFRSNNAPENLQQVNVFAAGPTLMTRLGRNNHAQLDLRYINTNAEQTESFNSDRYSAAARVFRDLDSSQRASLNMEFLRVEFDQPELYTEYDRRDLYFAHDLSLNRTSLHIEAGYTWLDLATYSATYDAPRVRATATWQVTPRSRLRGDMAYQFSEAAQDLVRRVNEDIGPVGVPPPAIPTPVPDGPSGIAHPDVYREHRLDLGYEYVGERVTVGVSPYYSRNDYLNTPIENRDDRGVALDLGYRLTPMVELSVSAWASTSKFDSFERKDRDMAVRVGVIAQLSRHWSAQVEVRHLDRDSTANEGSYVENYALVSIAYRR